MELGLFGPKSRGLDVATCSKRLPELHPIVESVRSRSDGKYRVVVAMLFPEAARTMDLKLRGKPNQTLALKPLPVRKQNPVNQVSLASFAKGYAHRFCIERLVFYDAESARIGGLGRQPCT